ncbi:MAG: SRPBCC family protein [Chloroflexota bacterium]|nr:SRPBCC family protein [Chloroflexota bacterium]
MSRHSHSIDIGASPEAVWAVLVDVEHWPTWASQFERLERLEAGPLAVGNTVRCKTTDRQATSDWVVTRYEDGRSFTWEASLAPGLRVTGGHLVTAAGDGVNVELWLEASGWLGRLLGPMLRRTIFSRNTKGAAEGLKRLMEARRRSATPPAPTSDT